MSYINDALRKVQKEKESGYTAYENIISASGEKVNRPQKWLSIIGIAIVFFWAVGIIFLLYRFGDEKMPGTAPVQIVVVARVVPVKPQIVKETIADKKNKIELKKETALPETKVKPEKTDSKIIYAQALQKQQEGNLEEAKSLYKKVVKIAPRNVQALNNLGVIYMKQKRYKWAIIRFNDAIKIKPDYTDAHYNLACLYAQENDVSRSMVYLKNAVEFNPAARNWARDDGDLKVLANLPEFKKLLEKQ
jgi:tetratricopeptide (TPR) repeat protein